MGCPNIFGKKIKIFNPLTPYSFPSNNCVASSLDTVGKNQMGWVRISLSSDVITVHIWLPLLRFTGTPPWLCLRLTPGKFPVGFSSRFFELGRWRLRGLLGRCPDDPGLDNPEFWFCCCKTINLYERTSDNYSVSQPLKVCRASDIKIVRKPHRSRVIRDLRRNILTFFGEHFDTAIFVVPGAKVGKDGTDA